MTTETLSFAEKRAQIDTAIFTKKEELRTIQGRGKAIQDRADAEGRDLSKAEIERVDRFYEAFELVEKQISDLQRDRLDVVDEQGGQSQGRVVPAQAPAGSQQYVEDAFRNANGGRRYAQMFGNVADPYGGKFKSLTDFAFAVANGARDQRLMVANSAMSEGSGVSAGYLVPPQFIAGVIDGALSIEVIRPNCVVLPMASNTLDTAGFDYQDGTSGKRAGLQLKWGPEAGTLSEQIAVARTISFRAEKANILVRVSSELSEDAIAFDSQLRNAFIATVGAGLDGAFISGTGSGQPLGILNCPALITQVKESGQAANTVFLQNLAGMLARLTPASYKRSTWLVHPTVIPKLLTLTVVVMNVAGTENVGGGLAAAVVQNADGSLTIFGRPVVVTDACSALSSAGDIMLVDLSQYAVGMRRDVLIEVSRDAYFTTDEIGFKLTMRLDGQPLASAATKLRDGTNTVSPFVALGAR